MFVAELVENRLVVWNPREGSELYGMGFYGKPVGIPKPKTEGFEAPLNLGLIEGLYLLERGLIKVFQGPEKRWIRIEELREHARQIYEGFDLNYLVYKDLRKQVYIFLLGIKFGCLYAIYKYGLGIDHAPYLVSVRRPREKVTSMDIVRAGRLATSVRKRFIMAIPNPKTGEVSYSIFNWFKA